jgi:CDGSH-type Zn-finger protein
MTQESFRPAEFAAYYRRVCRRLEGFVADPPSTEPYPVERCGICEFKPLCDGHWDRVDHLSRVARIQRRQIARLEAGGITTLAALGRAPREPVPTGREFRVGGREAPVRYGGSFKTKREALERKAWIAGELANKRVPDLRFAVAETVTLRQLAARWQAGGTRRTAA